MTWDDFFFGYSDWAESTIRTRISSLEDIGSGEDVVWVVMDLPSDKLKTQLIRKAMKLNASFSRDDFADLDGELPDEVYRELGNYTGYDVSNPYLDEDHMTWEDFSCEYDCWNVMDLKRRISKLKQFGPAEEVCWVIGNMPNAELKDALYKRAVACGVKFTREDLEDMGRIPIKEANRPDGRRKGPGKLFLFFVALLGGRKKRRKNVHRNDSCEERSPHYGYRYGRWYYGNHHHYGCEPEKRN